MKQIQSVLAIMMCGLVIGIAIPTGNLGADDAQFVPGISPPIELGMIPMACYAPGTDQRVIDDNAARALFRQMAMSLSASGDERFQLANRWSTTATDGSGLGQGDPTNITWSIVADGVSIPGFNGEPSAVSDLRAFLDVIYGNEATWMPIFQSIFDSWGTLTGFNYTYENADDNVAFSSTSTVAPGVLGVRADIRIGGHFIDGNSNVLAYNFFPNNGEMVIDTADNFYDNTSGNSLGMRNVLAHEHGHGMGLSHVCPVTQTKLMEPFVSSNFDGPQHDDILAANRHYGDAGEHNDTTVTSTDQGSPGSTTLNLTDLSIDDVGDSDFFSFTVGGGTDIDVSITPVGFTYLSGPQCTAGTSYNSLNNQDLAIEVIDLNGSTVVNSADSNAAGLGETLTAVALNSGAGKYWIKITGGSASDPQLYTMSLTIRDGGVGPATGACCASNGTCSENTQSACTAASGTYQGDGTLCAGVSCPVQMLLYDQTGSAATTNASAQDFETNYDSYDAEIADDFVVTDAAGWDVNQVVFQGGYSAAGPLSLANVAIYDDAAGMPGSAMCGGAMMGLSVVESPALTFTVALPSCQLPQGTYWLGLQAQLDFNPLGQVFITRYDVQVDSPAMWRNPGDGFGTGCTSFSALTGCLVAVPVSPDLTFQIHGSVAGAGDTIFADGFESGATSMWSSTTP